MNKTCRQCQVQFEITSEDLQFYDKVSPVFAGQKCLVSPPTLCPDCRKQRRLAWRNERKLYHRTCNSCSKEMISIYAPDKPYNVFCLSCWWDDKNNPTDYGMEYDSGRLFFEQFNELLKKTPLPTLISSPEAEENNCSYINFAGNSKNCYMTFDADFNQDSYYSNVLKHSRNCLECSYVQTSELCYECMLSTGCYHLFFSQECTNCQDSYFLKNCLGCSNCFMCVNLNHKEYCIKNKQYTKEEYQEYVKQFDLGSRDTIRKLAGELQEFALTQPNKCMHGVNYEDCEGDYMINVKNCYQSFTIGDSEDLRYCDSLYRAKDCMDVSSFGEKFELGYESVSCGVQAYNQIFCQVCASNTSDLAYNYGSRQSKDSFGSVALKSNQYCILNKQYTKAEYEKLVPKIIADMTKRGEWGEFFPISISPFAYNESVAPDYFPASKEQIKKLGGTWYEETIINRYQGPKYTVPENIRDVSDTIIQQILTCESCQKNYKLIAPEVQFYQQEKIPLPVNCFNCRHLARMRMKNPEKLWDRQCMKCHVAIKTSYSPDRPEIVYCEKCYLEAVY